MTASWSSQNCCQSLWVLEHSSQKSWRVQMMNQNNQCYDGQFWETHRFIKSSPQNHLIVCVEMFFGTDLPPPPPFLWELIVSQIFNQRVIFFGVGVPKRSSLMLAELAVALEMSKVQLLDSFHTNESRLTSNCSASRLSCSAEVLYVWRISWPKLLFKRGVGFVFQEFL